MTFLERLYLGYIILPKKFVFLANFLEYIIYLFIAAVLTALIAAFAAIWFY